jgi:hypothetical protein
MKDKILEEFSVLDCIISHKKLEEYVDFCLSNTISNKNNSSSHHILPVAKTLPFKKFENLKDYPWNKAELSYYNHYYAHFLLAQAINHLSVITAFCGMHKKDIILERLSENDLINESEFNDLYTNRNVLISKWRKEIISIDGVEMSRAKFYNLNRIVPQKEKDKHIKRMKENNIVHLPGVLEKLRKTKSETFINGKNLDTISAELAAETMKKEFYLESGELTTRYKENGRKISKTLNTEFLDSNGNITTLAKEKGKIIQKTLIAKGKFYYLKNVFDFTICEHLPAVEIRKICANLEKKTKENYLGQELSAQTLLIKNGKEHFIGSYVERCP